MSQVKKPRHEQLTSINAKVARNINRAIVLNLIRERQPVSRASISRATGLNKSTVSNIVASLLAEDLVAEQIDQNREVGRNPLNLRVRTGKHFVGAIYFESTKTELAIVDISGTIKNRIELESETDQPYEFATRCVRELESLRVKLRLREFRGIGIAVAGIVDSYLSKVIYAPNLGWQNFDLGQAVRKLVPGVESVAVENDAKASALAELLLGKYVVPSNSLVFVSVGYGIGAGIVLDNHILGGSSHAAGEFGHMTIVEEGERCSCGNKGCWEVYASDRATITRYTLDKKLPADQMARTTMSEILQAAQNGEPAAKRTLTRTGQFLGRGIANIIRSFDPEIIIIGGLITKAWDLIYPEIMETVNARGFFGKERNTTILPTSLTDSPPLLGGAALSIRQIFADRRISM